MSLTCIGVGPGDKELLTVKAVRLIEEADIIMVPVKKRNSTDSTALKIAEDYIEDRSKVHYLYFPMVSIEKEDLEIQQIFKENASVIKDYLEQGKDVIYLTLGDSSVYSTFTYMADYLDEVEYVPGIASFLQGAAHIGRPLCIGRESLAIINMTDEEEKIREFFRLHDNIVVMKVSANPSLLHELLTEGKRQVTFLSNLGMKNESITDELSFLQGKVPYFTVAQVKR